MEETRKNFDEGSPSFPPFEKETYLTTLADESIQHMIRAYPNHKITIQLHHLPEYGKVQFISDRILSYIPNSNFKGMDQFSLLLENELGNMLAIPFTVFVCENKENEKKTLTSKQTKGKSSMDEAEKKKRDVKQHPSSFSTYSGKKLQDTIPVKEEDDNPYTISLKKKPQNGEAQVYPDGTFDYTPPPFFVGKDSFKVTQRFCENKTGDIDINITVRKQEERAKRKKTTQKKRRKGY